MGFLEALALPPPARYFPPRRGRYDVSPSLLPLETDFGNGAADQRVFQLDARFPYYRENKRRCREERLGKYHGVADYPPEVAAAIARFIAERLALDYPQFFRLERRAEQLLLDCRVTRERLTFDPAAGRVDVDSPDPWQPPYVSPLDALACQVQEDLAVVCADAAGRDRLAAVHVCCPSAWEPEKKLGLDFAAVHAPVPGMERVLQAGPELVTAAVHRGPFVRFVWGIARDERLNRHPEPPPGVDAGAWHPEPFDPDADPPFVLRIERQVLWGLPEVGAYLFTIRPGFLDSASIRDDPEKRRLLRQAVAGMSPAAREYKEIHRCAAGLLRWLEA